MIRNEGYRNVKCVWYWNPKYRFFRGLRPINSNANVLKFVEDANGFELVDVYVEYSIGNPEVIDEAELVHDYVEELHVNGDCTPNSDDE